MTFIAGFHCSDGIVLCADSLESGGLAKKSVGKMTAYTVGMEWGVAWGCAGDGDVCDKFSLKLRNILGNANYDYAAIETAIEGCLTYIAQKHPDSSLQVIVGIFGKPWLPASGGKDGYYGHMEHHLLKGIHTSGCLAPINHTYCVSGMDVTLAEFILRDTHNPMMSVDEAARLGILATALMKKYAEGVDGEIDVFSFSWAKPYWRSWGEDEVAKVEAEMPLGEISRLITEYWYDKNPTGSARFLDPRRSNAEK